MKYFWFLCLALVTLNVPAQEYPNRPIRIYVPAAPGGTTDLLARLFGAKLGELLKQQVVVENRASASGVIAGELTAKALPDGYTLLLAYHQHTINGALNPNLPYHAGELYSQMARVKAQHIPYKGSGPALVDLIGGRYDYNFAGIQAAQPHVRSGKLRGLAVTTPQRVAAMPDVPAVAEAIPGYEVVGWYGVIGPAGMPAPLVERLHHELLRVLAQPDVHERIVNDGSEPVGNSPREFRDFMAADLAKWAKVVKESGAKFE